MKRKSKSQKRYESERAEREAARIAKWREIDNRHRENRLDAALTPAQARRAKRRLARGSA
jgi:hypothetical protein